MLKDYFLKFNSKDEALQVFSSIPGHTFTPYDENNNSLPLQVVQQTETFAIDEVGIIYNDDGVYDDSFEQISAPTVKTGYHYNYRMVFGNLPETPIPSELESFLVTPKKPSREFF
jgi:hypothetical protein